LARNEAIPGIWGALLRANTCSRIAHSMPISVSNCAQAEQVEVSRERSGRRGASGLSACPRVPSEAAQSGYSPQVYGGLALARLAGEVSSETVASSLTHGRLFRLGDLCPSAPVELTRLVNHPLGAVASCLLSWFPPCQHDSHPSSVIPIKTPVSFLALPFSYALFRRKGQVYVHLSPRAYWQPKFQFSSAVSSVGTSIPLNAEKLRGSDNSASHPKSMCQQFMLWDIHRRESQLLVCTQLVKQFPVRIYGRFVYSESR
jgi:hypothetical protein